MSDEVIADVAEAPAEEPNEQAQLEEFLAGLGVPTPEGGDETSDDEEELIREPAQRADAPPVEPPPPAAEEGFRRRQGERMLQTAQQENAELKSYLNYMLRVGMGEAGAGGAPQRSPQSGTAQPAAPDAAPDLFQDPEGFILYHQRPLIEKINQLTQQNAQLAGEWGRTRAQEVSARQQAAAVNELAQSEREWEAEHPGYLERLQSFATAYIGDLIEAGVQPEHAQALFRAEVQGLTQIAYRLNVPTAKLADRFATRYLGGAQPASNGNSGGQPAARPDGQIEAARRVQQQGPTGSVSRAGSTPGEVTIDTLRSRGVTPEMVHKIMSGPRGRQNFFELMRREEARANRQS